MTKEVIIKQLGDSGVDVSLTETGEIRAELLELALAGVEAKKVSKDAKEAAEAYEKTIKTLNAEIETLQKRKTPAEKAGLILHKKSKKTYRLKHSSIFRGEKLNAEVLNENQQLLTDLIASGSTILVEEKED